MNLEAFSTKVAETVAGPKPETDVATPGNIGAPDWTALIELIATMLMSLLGDCPANDNKIVAAIRKPNFLQRARFKAHVSKQCSQCFTARWKNEAGVIAEATTKEVANLSDGELLTVLFESRNPDWLVI